jgi:hypothetical protein
MKVFYPKNRYFLVLFFMMFTVNLFSQEKNSLKLREFLFDTLRYSLTLTARDSRVKNYYELSKEPSKLLMLPVWKSSGPLYLYEIFYPEYKGQIELSFIQSNLSESFSAYWIDNAVMSYMASSGLSSGGDYNLLEMLDNKNESAFIEEDKEITQRLKDGTLRKFYIKDEKFSLSSLNGLTFITSASTDSVQRRIYDESFRLIKKEVYNSPEKVKELDLEKLFEYEYESSTAKVLKRTTEDFSKKTKNETFYLENGKPQKSIDYHYEKDENDKKKEKYILLTDCEKNWTWDEENRLKELSAVFYYTESKGKKSLTTEKRQLTQYSYGLSTRPDVSFFEDGQLRGKTVYTSENDYIQKLFFDESFCVESAYEDGIKVSEIIALNGTEVRRRTFEKE